MTGFALELALYLPSAPAWGYWVFLFHVAVAMELVLLAPFIKFAHAIYRPLALFFLALAGAPGASPPRRPPVADDIRPARGPHASTSIFGRAPARATSAKPAERRGGLR